MSQRSDSHPLYWYQVWWAVLVRPKTSIFLEISERANVESAYRWYFVGSIIFAIGLTLSSDRQVYLFAFGFAIVFALYATLVAAMTRIAGGKASFEKQHLLFGAIVVTVSLGMMPLNLVINDYMVGLLGFFLWSALLSIIATKAVHDVGWITAFLTNLLVIAMLGVFLYSLLVSAEPLNIFDWVSNWPTF